MLRSSSALLLGTALLVSAVGCRHNCTSNGWSANSTEVPCQLTGNGKMMDGCFDPISGRPMPCPPSTMPIPSGGYPGAPGTRPDELPFPAPSDMIPRPGVPYAPPMPAPGVEGASVNPKSGVTSVKNGANK